MYASKIIPLVQVPRSTAPHFLEFWHYIQKTDNPTPRQVLNPLLCSQPFQNPKNRQINKLLEKLFNRIHLDNNRKLGEIYAPKVYCTKNLKLVYERSLIFENWH